MGKRISKRMNIKDFNTVRLNMLMNVMVTLSSIIFPLISLPYVTGILGAERIGKVFFASSVISVFAVFSEFGIPVYGIKTCARVRDDRKELSRSVCEIVIINIAVCLATYCVFVLCLFLIPRFADDRFFLAIMSLSLLFNTFGLEWVYKGLEKYAYIAIRTLVIKSIALIAMFVLIRTESDYYIYGGLTVFVVCASDIVNLLGIGKYIDFTATRLDKKSIVKHIPAMFTLFSLSAAVMVYTSLDSVMLDVMKGDMEVGLYGVAVKIKIVSVSIITSLSAVILPRMSLYYKKEKENEFKSLLSNTMMAVNMISFPIACYFVLIAPECIQVLAGDSFHGAVQPMRIIMLSVVFIGISNIIGMHMLIPMGMDGAVVKAALIGAGTDFFLNIVLIPFFSATGTAMATLAAEITVMSFLLYKAHTVAGSNNIFDTFNKDIVIAVMVASIICAFFKLLKITAFLKIVITGIVFLSVYIISLMIIRRVNGVLRKD